MHHYEHHPSGYVYLSRLEKKRYSVDQVTFNIPYCYRHNCAYTERKTGDVKLIRKKLRELTYTIDFPINSTKM